MAVAGGTAERAERTKTLRKIKQAKAVVEAAKTKPEKKAAYRALREARIDLHYILVRRRRTSAADRQTFPNDRKYISLYPGGAYVPHERSLDAAESEDFETIAARAAMRDDIRKQMKDATLAVDPEVELEQRAADPPAAETAAPRRKRRAAAPTRPPAPVPPQLGKSKVKAAEAGPDDTLSISNDPFFDT